MTPFGIVKRKARQSANGRKIWIVIHFYIDHSSWLNTTPTSACTKSHTRLFVLPSTASFAAFVSTLFGLIGISSHNENTILLGSPSHSTIFVNISAEDPSKGLPSRSPLPATLSITTSCFGQMLFTTPSYAPKCPDHSSAPSSGITKLYMI